MSDPLDTDDGGCDWRYLPPSCTEPLYAHYMPLWYLLIFGMVGVHGSLVVVSALSERDLELEVGAEDASKRRAKAARARHGT